MREAYTYFEVKDPEAPANNPVPELGKIEGVYFHEDPLAPARGVMFALVGSLVLWGLISAVVVAVFLASGGDL